MKSVAEYKIYKLDRIKGALETPGFMRTTKYSQTGDLS